MKTAVTGGSGLIGSRLVQRLIQKGERVIVISRTCGDRWRRLESGGKITCIAWDQLESRAEELEGLTAIVHLAGETINQRWNEQAKQEILRSRIESTVQLSDIVKRLQRKPETIISGSAVGIYGMDGSREFDEYCSVQGDDFLAQVVRLWEAAADQFDDVRVVKLRTGVVLDRHGGALPKMMLPYKLGVGGPIGSGRQWLSWIHIEDIVNVIEFCMHNRQLNGPVNAVSPQPVTNDEFGRMLGMVLKRPHYLPLPAFVMKLVFGEMSSLLTEGQKAVPKRLMEHGFQFQFDSLKSALYDLLSK